MTETKGFIFDIKELAVYDGPGIRTTVFLKGCPMRCRWCHNPEGLMTAPQLMVSDNGCLHCGKCTAVCPHPDHCTACGACVHACPLRLRRIAGETYTAAALSRRLKKDAALLSMAGGGITISGGEPTLQAPFLIELLQELTPMHRAIETCGFCDPDTFRQVLTFLDYVIMDIKLVDSKAHQFWTGCDNACILQNLKTLAASGLPFVIRIPLIPGVNDTDENLTATAELLKDYKTLERVELLPYHRTAGAKYGMVGMTYAPGFDPDRAVNKNTKPFEERAIPVAVL